MKPEEAIKVLNEILDVLGHSHYSNSREYIAVDTAIQALEKQVAKKVDISPYNIKFCPVCKGSVWQIKHESKYCFRCGQKIDWSEN